MKYNTTLAEQAYALAGRWHTLITAGDKGSASSGGKFEANDIKGWNANQIVVFLEKLHSGPHVPPAVVKKLDEVYSFSKATNGEILLRFYEVALEVPSPDSPYAKMAAEWVKGQGRMKFCRTIYRALNKVEPELAKKTFTENKSFYHPIAAAMIEKVSLAPFLHAVVQLGNRCSTASPFPTSRTSACSLTRFLFLLHRTNTNENGNPVSGSDRMRHSGL